METTPNCRWCGNELPPRTSKRGRPKVYCGPACRKAAQVQRAHEAEAAEADAKRRKHVDRLTANIETVIPPSGLAPTPGSFVWHTEAVPAVEDTAREHIDRYGPPARNPVTEHFLGPRRKMTEAERLTEGVLTDYRRVWSRAATADERRAAERGQTVYVAAERLYGAIQVVAAEMVNDGPQVMSSTRRKLAALPDSIAPERDGWATGWQSAALTKAEAQGESYIDTGGQAYDNPYTGGLGYYLDDYGTYEADPARRTGPRVRQGRWRDEATGDIVQE